MPDQFRIPFDLVEQTLTASLIRLGCSPERAAHCAHLFADTTADGVYTHGVARFPRLVKMIALGEVRLDTEPKVVASFNAIERWDGQRGLGNLAAWAAMNRAIALSTQFGIGFVALANTNHWMRAGTYGRQAAEAGRIGICWTNTLPNMPFWGGSDPVIGNNPLVIAVPRAAGPVVLDMAMSQFSYGTIEAYKLRGEQLPVDGGFDSEGNLTRDPAAIEASLRPLSIGYWKGSGLAMLMDMVAGMTSLGLATHQLSTDFLHESGISQVFFAIHPQAFGPDPLVDKIADDIVASIHNTKPIKPGTKMRYPGEKTIAIREKNLRLGIPIDKALWDEILAL
jgi:3-dehydro-L-gulonate 2-dehydrogenase